MQDDTFLAFLEGHRARIERLQALIVADARTRAQIERSRLAIAYSRMLLSLPVVTARDTQRKPHQRRALQSP
jgi:hypothetical protein